MQKLEFLNLEPKMPSWVFLAAILKIYCHIWNQHPSIFLIATFGAKKPLSFGTKNARFAYFRARIWIHSYNIWNQNLWICLFGKYHEIMKMSKYRMKNTCNFQILLMCLKSAPSNLSNAKFCEKNNKMPKFETKNASFYIWLFLG